MPPPNHAPPPGVGQILPMVSFLANHVNRVRQTRRYLCHYLEFFTVYLSHNQIVVDPPISSKFAACSNLPSFSFAYFSNWNFISLKSSCIVTVDVTEYFFEQGGPTTTQNQALSKSLPHPRSDYMITLRRKDRNFPIPKIVTKNNRRND